MVLKEINLGKHPIYYVQKSYRKENGRPATKNYERLGTIEELSGTLANTYLIFSVGLSVANSDTTPRTP